MHARRFALCSARLAHVFACGPHTHKGRHWTIPPIIVLNQPVGLHSFVLVAVSDCDFLRFATRLISVVRWYDDVDA